MVTRRTRNASRGACLFVCGLGLALVPHGHVFGQRLNPHNVLRFETDTRQKHTFVTESGHECGFSVEPWETGSWWFEFAGTIMQLPDGSISVRADTMPRTLPQLFPDPRFLSEGTTDDSGQGRKDAESIFSILTNTVDSSRDMEKKVTDGCIAKGGLMSVRVVRDDPEIEVGAYFNGTNLIIIDVGDLEKLEKQMTVLAPPGTPERTISDATMELRAVIIRAVLAHEFDHAAYGHPDPVENDAARRPGDAGLDENRVLTEQGFKIERLAYVAHHQGQPIIPYRVRVATPQGSQHVAVLLNAGALSDTRHATKAQARFGSADLDTWSSIPVHHCGAGETDRCFPRLGATLPVISTDAPFALSVSTGDVSVAGQDKTSLAIKAGDPPGPEYAFSRNESVDLTFARIELSYQEADARERLDRLRTATIPADAADANVNRINSASTTDKNQQAGGSVLRYVEETVVISEGAGAPRLPWALPWASSATALSRRTGSSNRPSYTLDANWRPPLGRRDSGDHPQTIASAASAVKAIFVATGRSSGAAFEMTMAYDGPEPLELVDPGFVLEPVQGLSAAQAEREIGNVKGRRVKVLIDAYCLQMRKPPPAAGMVYRLAKNAVQQRNPLLAPIMIASKVLKDAGRLHPDTDPVQYFHTIRQWALWAHEQGFKSEGDFANAFIEHSRKNVAAAGRQWTPELEHSVRRLLPNRWRDISEVLKLALPPVQGR